LFSLQFERLKADAGARGFDAEARVKKTTATGVIRRAFAVKQTN
jgi:hypothetical protein